MPLMKRTKNQINNCDIFEQPFIWANIKIMQTKWYYDIYIANSLKMTRLKTALAISYMNACVCDFV